MNFNNKNAYITGGSSGIGFAIASLLVSAGANVLLIARNTGKLESARKKLEVYGKGKVHIQSLDVSKGAEVRKCMETQAVSFGKPDILINSAGLAIPRKFEDISFEQFDLVQKTNLYGPWNMCSALIRHLKDRKGYIVNVSSVAGFIGVFGYTDYSASKFGLIGFSESLRSEFEKEGVSVSVLCPPDTDTPAYAQENKTKPTETLAISENAKLMKPEQVAKVLIRGMKKKKFMIIPGFDSKLARRAKNIAPGLVHYMVQRDIKKAAK